MWMSQEGKGMKEMAAGKVEEGQRESVVALVREVMEELAGVQPCKGGEGVVARTRGVVSRKVPRFKRALKDCSLDVMQWMREGGPFRAFLVTVVGLITLTALTGLSIFMLFFLVATANTVVVSFLVSLAAVGAFMTAFFTSLAVIYVGAVSIAALAVSTVTIFSIAAILLASGWVGFLWLLWQAVRKVVAACRISAVSSPGRKGVEERRY